MCSFYALGVKRASINKQSQIIYMYMGPTVAQSVHRLGYRLDTGIQFLAGAMMGFFLFVTACRPTLGLIKASSPMGTGGSYPGGKAAGA
jgi:hypothetical protein